MRRLVRDFSPANSIAQETERKWEAPHSCALALCYISACVSRARIAAAGLSDDEDEEDTLENGLLLHFTAGQTKLLMRELERARKRG